MSKPAPPLPPFTGTETPDERFEALVAAMPLPTAAEDQHMEAVAATLAAAGFCAHAAGLCLHAQHAWRCSDYPRVQRRVDAGSNAWLDFACSAVRLDDDALRCELLPLDYLDCLVCRVYASAEQHYIVLTRADSELLARIMAEAQAAHQRCLARVRCHKI